MPQQISRRQFLKTTVAGGAALGVTALFGLPALPARAKATVPARMMQQATAAPFSALPSVTPLTTPLADIAMGRDGTIWAIDTNGVPFSYDPLRQTWEVLVPGFDALTYSSSWSGAPTDPSGKNHGLPLVVRGSQIFPPSEREALALADAFSGLPASFALGLDGLAEVNHQLYLFRHGRYVIADTTQAGNPIVAGPFLLSDLAQWPTTANWSSGTFQALGSCIDDPAATIVHLFNHQEYLVVDMVQQTVTLQPLGIADYARGTMRSVLEQGDFGAVLFTADGHTNGTWPIWVYQGAIEWYGPTVLDGNSTPTYPSFGPFLTPCFTHAPSGQAGALWAATGGNLNGAPAFYDGSGWTVPSSYPHTFDVIAVGDDGAVFALADGNGTLLERQSNGEWSVLGTAPSGANHLTVGDAAHIWVLANTTIYRYQNGSFATVPGFATATHLAANRDGTVWAADNSGNAYRFLSEGTTSASPLAVGVGGTVVKVASTGFATGLALVQNGSQTQAQQYDAPYVWKTGDSYWPQFDYLGLTHSMVQAGHTMFIATEDPASPSTARLVYAIDTQTGIPVWEHPAVLLLWTNDEGDPLDKAADINLAYDPALNLVYAGGGMTLTALDAATGETVWALDYTSRSPIQCDIWGPPTVVGGVLCVSDRWNGNLVLIDTAASAAQYGAKVLWTAPIPHPDGIPFVTAGAPVFDLGKQLVYLVSQVGDLIYATAFSIADGSQGWHNIMKGPDLSSFTSKFVHDAVIGQSTEGPSLLINGGIAIYVVVLADGSMSTPYVLPQPSSGPQVAISSGLSLLHNQLFFGDTNGTLYGLDTTTMQRVTSTSDSVPSGVTWYGVLGTPQLAHTDDPNDGVAVLFARGDQNVWVFDPSNGALESIATDQTRIAALQYDQAHGLLYGCSSNGTTAESLGQIFALRPDQAIQDERAFIIESQLMQDYGSDDEAAGDGVARYQTHVSVVDDNKVARSNIAVKLWAEDDTNATIVNIDGSSYTIGTTQAALFTTDGTGTFTITSDASDLSTTSFRLWTAFMDASERITITPDAAFHQRLAAATATGDTTPSQVDLISAQSYDGNTLFASNEQDKAQQSASGISSTLGAVGVSTPTTNTQQLSDSALPKYHAYANLPGMAYSPSNQAAHRAITPVASFGLSLTSNGYTTLHPADAANLIDAMQGDQVTGLQLGSVFSKLKSAWKEIKATAAKVTQAVVSIAKEVYVGITYVVNGITKVVKDIAHDIDDALAAIGSFFVQLGKDLLKVIEALSLFLHLKEVYNTSQIISAQINAMLSNLSSTLQTAKTDFDGFFADADNKINEGFCHLFDILGLPQGPGCSTGVGSPSTSSTPLNTLNGAGSTPTSVYNTGQSGGSQAVQCGWSSHTLRTNLKGGSETTSAQLAQASDDFLALLEGFFSDLTTDPNLARAYSAVGNTFSSTFKVSSPKQFLEMAVEDLLELLKAILITGVTIVKAFVDTLLGAIDTVVQQMQNLGNAKIPILSTLWHKLTGHDLTFIDLLSFVLAFPVTLIYRATTGYYPSASSSTQAVEQIGLSVAPSTEKMVIDVMGLVGTFGYLVGGLCDAFLDALYVTEGSLAMRDYGLGWVSKLSGVCSLFQNAGTVGFSQVDPADTWKQQTIARGMMIVGLKIALFAGTKGDPEASVITAPINSIVSSIFAAWGMVINGLKYATSSSKNPLVLSQAIMSLVPNLINPIKLPGANAESLYPFVASIADWYGNLAAGALLATEAIKSMLEKDAEEAPHIFYFPMVGR